MNSRNLFNNLSTRSLNFFFETFLQIPTDYGDDDNDNYNDNNDNNDDEDDDDDNNDDKTSAEQPAKTSAQETNNHYFSGSGGRSELDPATPERRQPPAKHLIQASQLSFLPWPSGPSGLKLVSQLLRR